MTRIESFLEGVESLLKWMCVALVIGLTLVVFLSVVFRYALSNPLEWVDEVVGFFILGLTYFGSAMACGRRSQIYVEVLESALKGSPRALLWARIITDGITMVALSLMVYVGFQLCLSCEAQKTEILMLSYFWVYMIMPVGVAFMLLMMLKRLIFEMRSDVHTESSAAH